MSHRKLFLAGFLLAALVASARTFGEESQSEPSQTKTNKLAFNATLRGGETVGDHQIFRAFLHVGTNEVAFIVPTGFQMDASNPQKIVISDNDGRCFMTVRVDSAAPESEGQEAYFRGLALQRFPGAKITDETTEAAANHSGPSFTLQWVSAGGAVQSASISFILTPAGVLEFSTMSRTADFNDARLYLRILLSSVQTNESGKLVIVPLPTCS
jgi:hypothetical protein